MNPLSLLAALARTLQGGQDPRHLAAGFALGAAWGLVPKGNMTSVVFLLLFVFFQVDKPIALVTAFLFSFIGWLVDPVAHALGYALLVKAAFLKPFWTALYGLPLLPLTKFNNTVVLGNLVIGAVLFAPLYAVGKRGAEAYAATWGKRVSNMPLVKAVTSLKVVQWYRALRSP